MSANIKHVFLRAALTLAIPYVAHATDLKIDALMNDPFNVYSRLPSNQSTVHSLSTSCTSQLASGIPLGIVEVVDLTMCNNPQLKATWAAVKFQASALGEARAAWLPSVSINVNRLRTDEKYESQREIITGNTAYVSVNWLIYDFGLRAANEHMADNLLSAALANNDAAIQKSLSDTIQAYFDAQSARATWQSKKLGAATAETTLASAQRRESRGMLARTDRLQAATALARAQLDENRAYGNYRKAMALLIYTMGLALDLEITLAPEVDENEASEATTQLEQLSQWLSVARKKHPTIRAAKAEVEASQSRVASTRAENMPNLSLSGNFYKNGYPGQGISPTASEVKTVGISLNIPLLNGLSQKYKVGGAVAQAEQKEQAFADTEHRVLMEVVRVHAEASAALRNLRASAELMHIADESMKTFERKYDRGASDIVELLTAQAALADAREQRVISISEWRSARLRVIAACGVLGFESLGQLGSIGDLDNTSRGN